jgi:F-type H+/Na+-transporting ATPase subunit alpha
MDIKSSDLITLFEKSLTNLSQEKLEETGVVIQVGDNICKVYGLINAVYGELIDFEGGNKGIIFSLEEDYVAIFLLYTTIGVSELEVAKRTGSAFKAPVGMNLLGRTLNAIGQPIDALGELNAEKYKPIEEKIPGIIERSPIDEPLQTGILVIDVLVPIGKGQRELIIGNRNTGKTSIVLDTILNQKGKNVYCIYVSIGQRQANLARIIATLEENDALGYSVIVSADASESSLNQYLAPYVGCTIAEYFRDKGHDALIIYDDLSNHAIAYREMSLLLRRPPGREAYPGDVFFLHSRLLERAGKLTNGGSVTALPIVQIQGDDITAYIPTNLISITDGQIFLDTQLFNQGVRPAVNIELSVSRVGSAAQTKAVKRVTKSLRLEIAQYNELLDFSQFGTELDIVSQKRLARGALAQEILKQPQFKHYTFVDETLILFLLKENFLQDITPKEVQEFVTQFISYMQSVYSDLYNEILESKDLSESSSKILFDAAQEFKKIYVPSEEKK